LGGRLFIKEAMSRLKDGIVQREETSNRKQLQALYGSDHIIDTISAYFKVPSDEVLTNSRGYRNLAIYLMKRFTGMTNRQIGELFGGLSYSAIAKVHQRLSAKLRNDQSLRKTVEHIVTNLSLVKG
jgi:chromosomal replication initiation ATPase DnaA